tara:strand:+ start:1824 stop:3098 length:1275 start_codon:yes stop_codon:yes gene_type:complete
MNKERIIYLDHAATTYLDEEVKKVMDRYWEEKYANPSSPYGIGKRVKEDIEKARSTISNILGIEDPKQIIFTAGGTESINLAIIGVVEQKSKRSHIITSSIEHRAVLHSCKFLEENGHKATYLPVDKEGFIDITSLQKNIRKDTILVSIMYANNEIGTIQPLKEISSTLKKINTKRSKEGLPKIFFHTDACQAGGLLDLNVRELGIDLLTINASKIYGPKQVGMLYFSKDVLLRPIIFGGGQERNLRSGTENVPGIIGLAKSLEIAQKKKLSEKKRLKSLCLYILNRIKKEIPDVIVNGPKDYEDKKGMPLRLPNNINISFKGLDEKILISFLDKKGICVSSGSACSSKESHPSHVLLAIGCPKEYIKGTLRITLGKRNNKRELDFFIESLKKGVKEIRETTRITSDLEEIKGSPIDAGCIKMK